MVQIFESTGEASKRLGRCGTASRLLRNPIPVGSTTEYRRKVTYEAA
jgi:hypothetical protein